MSRILAVVTTAAALLTVAPLVAVRSVIALRTNYQANCETDAWMSEDFRQWAAELRRAR